ncbi:hypothetical protein [Streptomyces sp. NPDC048623]|uniref:hypothetical protein n=1 Tax=Streptomyces sp. NPDC048623 TaxID=3155761 RepID=UPI00343A2438
MGHSRAYPVFRSVDADEAYARGKELCGGLEVVEGEMWVQAELGTPERVWSVAQVVPGIWLADADGERYDPWGERRAVARFPVSALEERAHADVELPFLRAVGDDPAAMGWGGRWSGPYGARQYDGVQVSFHSDDVEPAAERPAATHTVFLHVDKRCPPERVRELAVLAGCELLGEARIGW